MSIVSYDKDLGKEYSYVFFKTGVVITTHAYNGIYVRQCLECYIRELPKNYFIVLFINESSDDITISLQKTYADAISPYIRVITKPIVDSVTIWVENNPVEIESIEASSGKVKLAYVLEKNVEICASFVFDVPVRFAADNFQYSFNSDGSIKVEDVELIEVYE